MRFFEDIPMGRLAWYTLGLVLGLLAVLGSCGCAAPAQQRVSVVWSPPGAGPWTHYVLEMRRLNARWTFEAATSDTMANVILDAGRWQARVAAVNDSMQGFYSEPSDTVTIPIRRN